MSAPLLSLENLAVAFESAGKRTPVVHGVSVDIWPGETVAIVGESGSGKSVTALSILKLLPTSASHPSGRIVFEGQDLLSLSEAEISRVRGNAISMIFQEPMTSLNALHTIERQIAEGLLLHQNMTVQQARVRVLELLEAVGIPDPISRLESYPHQLSGGQRQRVMIALALANNPRLLIADEPTTALDVTVQAQILQLLKSLQAKLNMAILFITHDLGIVERFADRVCVMQHGVVVEIGKVADIFANPQHPYTQMLLAAEPPIAPPVVAPDAPVLLEAHGMKVWHPIRKGFFRSVVGHVKALDGVDLTIREGSTLGVVGESGSGKTTLGLALLRLMKAEGQAVFMGQNLQALQGAELRAMRRNMQVVFQDPFGSLSPRMAVVDIVSEGLLGAHRGTMSQQQRRDKVAQCLSDVGLDPAMMDRYPHEFSGGQRQRIAIARALAVEPRFIVLDEPTSALDRSVQVQVVELLQSLQKQQNLTYLFISHDLNVVRALASEVIVMRHGRVEEAGLAADVFANPQSLYTKALLKAAFERAAFEGAA